MYENQLEHFIQRIDKKLLRYGLLGKQNWSDEMKHEFDAIAGEHMKLHYAYDFMS
ncbi:hypothetical protein [Lusitaniella coriacea]|uniref:hypothetical protein n=1 Tax=Lusitaniella coriacea TaxID=1983105 RepID=UPI003CE90A62